jgi:hypothetical protein
MVDIRRKSIVCREVWFDEAWSPEGADIVLYYHWSHPVNSEQNSLVSSLEIDLLSEESNIWKGFSASTKNQINRAIREEVGFQIWRNPDASVIDDFFEFNRQFTQERGFGVTDPEWMRTYSEQGALTLTRATAPSGQALVWHSYYSSKDWVRQMQSVSLFAQQDDKDLRNAIGRANRFLHWKDMQEFRKSAVQHFDFGGWYSGADDEKLLRVNAFKEEFGGAKTQRYHSTEAISLKGTLYVKAREYLRGDPGQLHWV